MKAPTTHPSDIRDLRFERHVARLHGLGARVVAELLREIGQRTMHQSHFYGFMRCPCCSGACFCSILFTDSGTPSCTVVMGRALPVIMRSLSGMFPLPSLNLISTSSGLHAVKSIFPTRPCSR